MFRGEMHQLKRGPNLVVHFGDPADEMFDVDYAALPGRLELAMTMLMPFRKKLLPPRRARSMCCGEAWWRISVTIRCRPARSIT